MSSTRSKRSSPEAAERGSLVKQLGPGIVSGASDNDPTTVATLAVVGATTVYGLAWLVVLVIPMLSVVQALAARVGAVSKHGLARCVRDTYGRRWAFVVLVAVLVVNVITLAADLEGGASAVQLLVGGHYRWYVVPFAIVVGALLVFSRYDDIERWLRFVPLVFLAYAGAAVLAHPNWGAVLHDSLIPHFAFTKDYVSGAIALLGTTLTAYAYVWETVEIAHQDPPLRRLGLVQVEAIVGIVAAGITFWFIVVATGATLGVHHHAVQTAQDAADALTPFAGRFASLLFGIGLLASALIAVPVIAGTLAYVFAETFGWRGDLDLPFHRAPAFYRSLLIGLAAGAVIAMAGVSPISLLFISSIAGGIATPLTLVFLMLVAQHRGLMKRHCITRPLAIAGWAVVAIVSTAVCIYLYQVVTGQS